MVVWHAERNCSAKGWGVIPPDEHPLFFNLLCNFMTIFSFPIVFIQTYMKTVRLRFPLKSIRCAWLPFFSHILSDKNLPTALDSKWTAIGTLLLPTLVWVRRHLSINYFLIAVVLLVCCYLWFISIANSKSN